MASKDNEQEKNGIEKLNADLTAGAQKVANNKKIIFWAVGGLVVIAAFVLSYLFIYRQPHLNKAYEEYNNVEVTAMGNDSVAAAAYAKVADKYSSDTPGKRAALDAAETYYNMGKYNEALKYLDKFSTSEPVLQANATILKGDCYVNLKKYDDALDCYKKAVSQADGNEQIAPRALLKSANIYDEQKKYADALACYEQIQKDFPTFQLGNGLTVDAYIAREKSRLGK